MTTPLTLYCVSANMITVSESINELCTLYTQGAPVADEIRSNIRQWEALADRILDVLLEAGE